MAADIVDAVAAKAPGLADQDVDGLSPEDQDWNLCHGQKSKVQANESNPAKIVSLWRI